MKGMWYSNGVEVVAACLFWKQGLSVPALKGSKHCTPAQLLGLLCLGPKHREFKEVQKSNFPREVKMRDRSQVMQPPFTHIIRHPQFLHIQQ